MTTKNGIWRGKVPVASTNDQETGDGIWCGKVPVTALPVRMIKKLKTEYGVEIYYIYGDYSIE